ncbi:MAG: leucine-rich repeat protein [Oscillospiraceae bacterium]
MKCKKLLSAMLAAVVISGAAIAAETTGIFPSISITAEAASYTDGDYSYTLSGGYATVTGYTGTGGNVTVPDTLGGYTVRSIGTLKNSKITSVTLPETVTTIGSSAFSGQSNITAVSLPAGLKEIGSMAFSGTSIASVSLPSGLESIGNSAFASCANLTSVTIPNSVTSVGYSAFSGCTSVAAVNIGTGITNISDSMFSGCTKLSRITVPANITAIGEYAFKSCSALATVTLNEGLGVINYGAFQSCTSLSSIKFPSTLTTLGKYAFSGCSSLVSVTFNDDLSAIGDYAFQSCHKLKTLNFGSGLVTIGNYSFNNCYSLTVVTIPSSVLSLGDYAFQGCSGITTLNFGAGTELSTISRFAFADCTSLQKVVIPNSVITLNANAFSGCTALTDVTFGTELTVINERAFADCSALKNITFNEYLSTLGKEVFKNCTALTSVTLPDSVTTMDDAVFYGCDHLINAVLPDTLSSVPEKTFYNCKALSSVTLPTEAVSVGNYAFFNCVVLSDVVLPSGLTSIGDSAFECCAALTRIVIPTDCTDFGTSAFSCTGLTTIALPEGTLKISRAMFQSCRSLENIALPGSVITVDNYAFDDCQKLTNILFGNKVTSLGENAFSNCRALTHIDIPEGVTEIPYYCFNSCYTLSDVKMPSTLLKVVGSGAFGDTALGTVIFPEGLLQIYPKAFYSYGSSTNDMLLVYPEGAATSYETSVSQITYTTDDNYAYIASFISCDTDVVVPDNIYGKPVAGLKITGGNTPEHFVHTHFFTTADDFCTLCGKSTDDLTTSFTAVGGAGIITAEWEPVADAEKYGIFAVNGSSCKLLGTIGAGATELTVDNIAAGNYNIVVGAYVYGCEPYLDVSSAVKVTVTAPNIIPQNVKAVAGDGKVTLTWVKVNGATCYVVKNEGTTILVRNITSNTATITGLTNGVEYSFRVFAYVNGKWGGASATVKVTPYTTVPQNVKAVAGNEKVTLTWDEVPGASCYTIKDAGTTILAKNITETTVTISGLTNGTEYSFRVFAYVNGKWGGASAVVKATPAAPPTTAPQNVRCVYSADTMAALVWDEVDGATAYTVKGADSSIYAKSITTNSVVVENLTPGTSYSFRVFAYVNGKWSGASAVVKVTTKTISSIVPRNVRVIYSGNGMAALVWDKVSGASNYTVKGAGSTIYAKSLGVNSVVLTGLEAGKTYTFRVYAYVGGKWSDASVPVFALV